MRQSSGGHSIARTLFLALVLLLAGSGTVFATNGMQLIGIGPVQRSMGGAGSALPLDSMVITVNPAAITELPPMVDLGVTYFAPFTDYEATHIPMMGGTSVDESSYYPASFIPNLGFVYPITDRFSLGLAIFGSAGMGVDYDPALYGAGVWTSFSMMKIVPAVAYKVTDELSLGLALNIDNAVMGFKAGGGPSHDKDSQWGLGFQAGIYYKPMDELAFSLSYISPQWFNDFEFDTIFGRDTMDLDLPMQIVFGVGWEPTERLRLALDLKWINWSATMGSDQPDTPTNTTGQVFDMDWSDQFVIAIGAEYDLIPETLKVRAGYNYGKHPLNPDRAFENIAFPALVEHHLTAGVGWSPVDNLWVNLGFMYAPSISISGSQSAQALSDYETRLNEYSIDFGISYRF